jgi:hypothetical protein
MFPDFSHWRTVSGAALSLSFVLFLLLPFAVIPSGGCGRGISLGVFFGVLRFFSLFGVFFTIDDVMDGAFDEGGAFEQFGIRYFEDLYFEKICCDEYRGVLRAIANSTGEWVRKSEIRKKVTLKETTLNNALAALTKRHILIPKKRSKGVCRLRGCKEKCLQNGVCAGREILSPTAQLSGIIAFSKNRSAMWA